MSAWKTYDIASRFPASDPGCYAIYLDGELVYVGSSSNVRKRLMDGHALDARGYGSSVSTPWGYFSRVIVKVRPSRKYGDWAMVRAHPPALVVGHST